MKNAKISRRSFLKAGAVASAVGMLSAAPAAAHAAEADTSAAADEENGLLDVFKKPKYVFLFIGDGMGTAQIQSARFYKGTVDNNGAVAEADLSFTSFPQVGSVTTYDSTSFCPDSASTATSIASGKKTESALLRMRKDGSGLSSILTTEGEVTGFDFDPEGNIWLTVLTTDGGALCRAGYDGWGAAMEQVVTQIDGKALTSPAAVTVGEDGRVYFAVVSGNSAKNGLDAALRTELMAHTATGSVYVYDPSARSVQQVLGGVAGVSGLALSPDGETLYVSDLGNRCVWAVSPNSRELTAGGKNCASFQTALPGYPGALAVDEEGEVYISYRWARSGWLEDHADGTLLRGAALRLSQNMQEGLFRLNTENCAVQGYSPDGVLLASYGGKTPGSMTALCPEGNRAYLSISGGSVLRWVRV